MMGAKNYDGPLAQGLPVDKIREEDMFMLWLLDVILLILSRNRQFQSLCLNGPIRNLDSVVDIVRRCSRSA